ncbi:hypothetical protein [Streptomyces sp. ODS28]|uniref:hypothetical protein n=1 Tax=Streptomyces sp. ODS28 TaxID=3136688 RepID=UPI0031EFCD34
MFKTRWAVRGAAGAVLITAAFTVVGLLWLMFTSGEDFDSGASSVRGTHFFGSLVFEAEQKADGALDATAGVGDPAPLVALFLVLAAVLTLVQGLYVAARGRRDPLA